jgi:hypothetical protein
VNRVSRVLVHDETILPFYITDVQYNVSISIDFVSIDTERQAPYKNGGTEMRAMSAEPFSGYKELRREPAA